jgi:hypothetical protein
MEPIKHAKKEQFKQWGISTEGDIDQIRFDRNFNPTQYHSITDVGFNGPDGNPDETDTRILSEINSSLPEGITATVLHGAVSLVGALEQTKAIRELEKLIALISGVKEINNQVVRK